MKTTYLLPCQCGERFQVDASESGLVMKCHCGASLEVPTLRGLARLEKVVVEEPSPSSRTWGGAQRGMAIGALIALIGIAMSIYWTVKPLPGPRDVFSGADLARLRIPREEEKLASSPLDMLYLWRMVEMEGLFAPPPQVLEPYHRARDVVIWWRVLSYIVAGLGLTVLGGAFAVFQWGGSHRVVPLHGGTPQAERSARQ